MTERARNTGILRGVLLFLAGLLVGTNLVYFLMTRHAAAPTPIARPAAAAPDDAAAPPSAAAVSSPVVPDAPADAAPSERHTPGAAATADPSAMLPAAAMPASGLLLPVRGVSPEQLNDTYNQTRGGTRIHEALDIMAPRGSAVLAATDGRVEKLFTSNAGGLTIYQFDPTGTHAYYYAHLERYAPGLREGQQLRRGTVIGEVGSTGNASPDAPHLHFAIFRLGPEKRWWEGTPVNPYPLLTGR